MNYSFHLGAEKELKEAENYYDNIREELGNRFRHSPRRTDCSQRFL
jgi:hypothetical protein